MSMTDPIADFLTRIRNGQSSGKTEVAMPSSRIKLALAKVLKDEGYLDDYAVAPDGTKSTLTVRLKYYQGRPVIDRPARVQGEGRAAEGARRHGRGHHLHLARRDDRPRGARCRPRRRSPLHRVVRHGPQAG